MCTVDASKVQMHQLSLIHFVCCTNTLLDEEKTKEVQETKQLHAQREENLSDVKGDYGLTEYEKNQAGKRARTKKTCSSREMTTPMKGTAKPLC